MNISKHIPAHIKRVSRSIGYFLWVGTSDDLHGVSVILRALCDPYKQEVAA